MEPTPPQLAQVVTQLLSAAWPNDENERREWFDRFQITPTIALDGFRRWGRGIPGWGDTTTCWGMSQEGFTGVSWFLWEGLTEEDRAHARNQLEAEFHERFGQPSLRAVPGHAGWMEWVRGDIVIELCHADAAPRRVQLHVIHQTRTVEPEDIDADRQDAPSVNGTATASIRV